MRNVRRTQILAAAAILITIGGLLSPAALHWIRWRTVFTTNGGEHGREYGWLQISRFGSVQLQRDKRLWYASSGFLAYQLTHDPLIETTWGPDGTVSEQWLDYEPVLGPSWEDGVHDQARPTAPWTETDEDATSWYERVYFDW